MSFVKIALAGLAFVVAGVVGFAYSMPEKVLHLLFNRMRHRSGLVRREIVLPDGLRYVYLEGGHGEPLMLLHGFGADKDNFTPVAHFLTPHYRVIVPDVLGFGEAARPQDADYRPPAQAERLRAFARALGIEKVHLGGNSMGGQIALTYAAAYPKEVESLWLIDTAGVRSVPKRELLEFIERTRRNPLIVKSGEQLAETLAYAMSKPPFIMRRIPGPMLDVLAQPRIENYLLEECILPQLEADSVEARVTGLATPTLIVWGSEDRVIPAATAGVLAKLLPHSQVIVMPGVGHLPMMEKPRESAADYLRFRKAGPPLV